MINDTQIDNLSPSETSAIAQLLRRMHESAKSNNDVILIGSQASGAGDIAQPPEWFHQAETVIKKLIPGNNSMSLIYYPEEPDYGIRARFQDRRIFRDVYEQLMRMAPEEPAKLRRS